MRPDIQRPRSGWREPCHTPGRRRAHIPDVTPMPPVHTAYFRKLPSVDEVLRSPEAQLWVVQSSRAVVTEAVREVLAATRQAILQATDEAALETLPLLLPAVLQQVQTRLQAQQTYHL